MLGVYCRSRSNEFEFDLAFCVCILLRYRFAGSQARFWLPEISSAGLSDACPPPCGGFRTDAAGRSIDPGLLIGVSGGCDCTVETERARDGTALARDPAAIPARRLGGGLAECARLKELGLKVPSRDARGARSVARWVEEEEGEEGSGLVGYDWDGYDWEGYG